MKKIHLPAQNIKPVNKGYNEKNPGQPQGAFPPDSDKQPAKRETTKSTAADKKNKEDQN